jgi:hypothetical protein
MVLMQSNLVVMNSGGPNKNQFFKAGVVHQFFLLTTHIFVFRNIATLYMLKYHTKEPYFGTS